jgi:predicted kinase
LFPARCAFSLPLVYEMLKGDHADGDYTWPMPKLIIVCGASFAGKSTLARLLADRFGYAEVDVDKTKAQLFGDDVTDQSLERTDWERIYHETDRRIGDHLVASRSVVDASRYFRKSERDAARAIGRERGADLVTVYVDTPEHITRERHLANRRSHARRDVTDADFSAILAAWEPPATDEHALVLRFDEDADAWVTRNAAAFAG